MIKGVFFDLSGTLYHYRELRSVTSKLVLELLQRLGVDESENNAHLQLFAQASKETDLALTTKPFYLMHDYFKYSFRRFNELLGVDPDEEHFRWYYQESFVRITNEMTLMPECFETLNALRSKGLYLSIASNIDNDMFSVLLNKDGLYKKVDHCTSSEEAKYCKPDERFFQVVLDKASLQAEDVLFVGDSPDQDIVGAHRAGMRTVLLQMEDVTDIPMHIGREQVEPDFCISALSELPELVDRI